MHDYEISVLSEDGSFAMSNVPPDEICIHFFPGSRVNIKGQPPKQVRNVMLLCLWDTSPCCNSLSRPNATLHLNAVGADTRVTFGVVLELQFNLEPLAMAIGYTQNKTQ